MTVAHSSALHAPVPASPFWLVLLSVVGLGCESDLLYREPPFDIEVSDSGPVDRDLSDAGVHDGGLLDSGPAELNIEPAREQIYVHTFERLFSFSPNTRRARGIGNFRVGNRPIDSMIDIAIDGEGRLFGGSADGQIYRIDPTTAACTPLFTVNDSPTGLAGVPDGQLIVAGARVWVVDATVGRELGPLVLGRPAQTSGDIVGAPNGLFYRTVMGGLPEGDVLFRIDPNTGQERRLRGTGVEAVFGLGYAEGQLFGFSANGVVVVLDPTTGSVIETFPLPGMWAGATDNPTVRP